MGKIINSIELIDKVILNILKYVTIAIFIFITLILSANIFVRFVPVVSLHWLDEIIELLFAALIFYGSAALWITKGHFSAGDWIQKTIKNQKIKYFYRMTLELMSLFFIALFLYYSYNLFMRAHDITNALAIPKKFLYLCLPVSGVIMFIYSLKNLFIEIIAIFNPELVKEFFDKKL